MPDPFPTAETPTGRRRLQRVAGSYAPSSFLDDEDLASESADTAPADTTPPLPVRAAPVLPPGTPRGSSGMPLPPPPPNLQFTNAAQPTATGTGTLQQQIGNLPLDQAMQAYSAALKFQAVRGYQEDLQRGKAPHEALAKWAPMMFTAPKEATLAGAASMMRASQPMVRNAGGQLFRIGPQGNAMPISPGKPAPVVKPTVFDTQEHKSYIDRIRALEKEIDEDPNGPEADAKRQEIRYYQSRANDVRNRFAGQTGTNQPPRISSREDYDRLPSGSIYIGKNGRRYRKP